MYRIVPPPRVCAGTYADGIRDVLQVASEIADMNEEPRVVAALPAPPAAGARWRARARSRRRGGRGCAGRRGRTGGAGLGGRYWARRAQGLPRASPTATPHARGPSNDHLSHDTRRARSGVGPGAARCGPVRPGAARCGPVRPGAAVQAVSLLPARGKVDTKGTGASG